MAPFLRRSLPLLLAILLPACGKEDPKPPAGTGLPKDAAAHAREAAKAREILALLEAQQAKEVAPAAPPAPNAPVAETVAAGAVDRWYDNLLNGQKAGTLHVVWAPSTWQGHPTIRDTTTETSRTARDMAGTIDLFESTTVTTTERGEDGTLWWTTSLLTEARSNKRSFETTWTGTGYDYVQRRNGIEEKKRVETPTPVQLDAESFLGPKIVRGEAKVGSTWTMRVLDVRGERVHEEKIEVVGTEPGPSEKGEGPCTRLRQIDPETKSEMSLWIDADGAVAKLKALSTEIRRVSPEAARKRPQEPATFSITAAADPALERIFSAERVLVDVFLRGDPDRPLPEYPTSPWSRVTGVEGSDEEGFVVHVEMKAYDAPEAHATIPVTDPAFKKDLETTMLLCSDQPDVVETAKRVVGDEKDARKAAIKIADFVFTTLRKVAPPIGDMTAVQLLHEKKGYCSDHCVLFTALCRAAGIPARRCSGFVCVGSIWGAHAWSEIWTGAWMGVDPTTNDVGTAARYLFYGYSDDPDSHPGVVSGRASQRMRFEWKHIDEGSDHLDLSDPASRTFVDAEKKIASHRLAGLEFRDWPKDWTVDLQEDSAAIVSGPGFSAQISAHADQGYRGVRYLRGHVPGRETRFGGCPAVLAKEGKSRMLAVSNRRRVVQIELATNGDDADPDLLLSTLEKVMAKTFTAKP